MTFIVDIKTWIGIHLHEPGVEFLVDKDVETQNLKAARVVVVIGGNEAMIGIFQIRFQCNDCFCGEILDLLLKHSNVFAPNF